MAFRKSPHTAIHAVKWSTLGEIASRGLSPIIFVILARILDPKDYGIAASAMILISFSQIFWEAGLTKALIQRRENISSAGNVVFWTNLFLSLAVYGALYISSDSIAVHVFKSPETANVIRIQGLVIPISALSSVQAALYQRNFNFRSLFAIRLITSLLPGIVSIPLALKGWGYWALVSGIIISTTCQTLLLWIWCPWKPKFEYHFGIAKDLIRFGTWVMGGGLLTWFYAWVDTLLVGIMLDEEYMGKYRTGVLLSTTIYNLAIAPLMPVLYSFFSEIQNDENKLRDSLVRITSIIAVLALPLGATLFLVGPALGNILLGASWQGAGNVISWYSLVLAAAYLVRSNSEAYRAIGRPDLETKIMFYCLAIYLPCYIIGLSTDFEEFLKLRFLAVLGSLYIHLYFASKYLSFRLMPFLKSIKWPLLSALFVLACVKIPEKISTFSFGQLIAGGFIGLIFFLAIAILPQWKALKSNALLALQKS